MHPALCDVGEPTLIGDLRDPSRRIEPEGHPAAVERLGTSEAAVRHPTDEAVPGDVEVEGSGRERVDDGGLEREAPLELEQRRSAGALRPGGPQRIIARCHELDAEARAVAEVDVLLPADRVVVRHRDHVTARIGQRAGEVAADRGRGQCGLLVGTAAEHLQVSSTARVSERASHTRTVPAASEHGGERLVTQLLGQPVALLVALLAERVIHVDGHEPGEVGGRQRRRRIRPFDQFRRQHEGDVERLEQRLHAERVEQHEPVDARAGACGIQVECDRRGGREVRIEVHVGERSRRIEPPVALGERGRHGDRRAARAVLAGLDRDLDRSQRHPAAVHVELAEAAEEPAGPAQLRGGLQDDEVGAWCLRAEHPGQHTGEATDAFDAVGELGAEVEHAASGPQELLVGHARPCSLELDERLTQRGRVEPLEPCGDIDQRAEFDPPVLVARLEPFEQEREVVLDGDAREGRAGVRRAHDRPGQPQRSSDAGHARGGLPDRSVQARRQRGHEQVRRTDGTAGTDEVALEERCACVTQLRLSTDQGALGDGEVPSDHRCRERDDADDGGGDGEPLQQEPVPSLTAAFGRASRASSNPDVLRAIGAGRRTRRAAHAGSGAGRSLRGRACDVGT